MKCILILKKLSKLYNGCFCPSPRKGEIGKKQENFLEAMTEALSLIAEYYSIKGVKHF